MRTFEEIATKEPANTSDGFEWHPSDVRSDAVFDVDERVAQSTPENVTLLDWAARRTSQPPQQWWDDETDPFAAEE